MDLRAYLFGGNKDLSNASEEKSHLQMVTLFGSYQIRRFVLENFISPEAKVAHAAGLIYIHDLDHIGPYCNSIDPSIPLLDGLNLPTLKAEPARHFGSALDHLYSYTMYSQQHFGGAQSLDWINWFLAPYALGDGLTHTQIKQEIQKFFFNCNQITRTGGKPPFINIGIRFECPKPLKDRKVVWKGHNDPSLVYSDGEVANKALQIATIIMEVLRDGMGGGIPFTYPLVATSILPETDFSSVMWDRAAQTIAKNGSLYIVNLRPKYMQDDGGESDTVSSQCCRVRVKFSSVGGIWSGGEMGTGSNRIITLNLAAIGYEAHRWAQEWGVEGSRDEYKKVYELVGERLKLIHTTGIDLNQMVHDSIYKWGINSWLATKTKEGIPYYDFSKRRLLIGISFIHDMLVNLGWEDGLLDEEGRAFALGLCEYIKDTISIWMREDPEIEWGIEAPPNESSNHFMAIRNVEHFEDHALSAHGSSFDNIEYAPATHLPYDQDIHLGDKIRAEAPFHKVCNGGNIFHLFLGENHPDTYGVKKLIEKLSETDLGYFALSPTFSICENGHCSNGNLESCPECGGEITDNMDRIVGYFERTSKFNPSKKAEWETRKKYTTGDI